MAKKSNAPYDKLARMIHRGFAETATKSDFRRLEERVEKLEGHMDILAKDVEYGFGAVAQSLKSVRIEIFAPLIKT